MKAAYFLILFIGTAIVCSCFAADDIWPTNELGGIENAAIVAKPVSVMAWRTVGSLELRSRSFGSFTPAHLYQKSGAGNLVSTNLASQLSNLLLDQTSYPHNDGLWAKNCLPEPAVVVTFSNGKKNVDIFFCFECNILIVKTNEKVMTDGLQTDFDPGHAKILAVIKKIFPKDQQIQSLQAKTLSYHFPLSSKSSLSN
jgi:hypothetical protein